MALTKNDIVKEITKVGLTNKESSRIVGTLLEAIKTTLENGEDVMISGFGKFYVKDKRERRGRNPHTGDDLLLGERRVVTFKCSSVLRDKINRK